MASNTLDPQKLISKNLRSTAKKNSAKSYAAWLSEIAVDPKIKASDDLIKANTLYAINLRDAKRNTSIRGSGYEKYLSELNKSSYLSSLDAAKNELEKISQSSLDGYREYVEGVEQKRVDLANSTFKKFLTLGLTDVNEAYRRARHAGLSESDAKLVAKETTSITRTELFQKAVENIISRYYTSLQAKTYAKSLGLPDSDADELGRIADILNQLGSNPNYYSGEYAKYIESLKNTIK